MKKLFIATVSLILSYTSFAQGNLDSLINRCNYYYAIYNSISPNSEYLPINKFNLNKEDEKSFYSSIEFDDSFNEGKDSVVDYELQTFFTRRICETLDRIYSHKDCFTQQAHTKIDIDYIASDDKKLAIFSWDENTGGTYRSKVSYMYYIQDDSTVIHSRVLNDIDSPTSPFSELSSDGYHHINTIKTELGTQYLLFSSVRTCTMCFDYNIDLIEFEQDKFVVKFGFNLSSRSYDVNVLYDSKNKEILIKYFTDDLTPQCTCSKEVEPNFGEDIPSKECSCKFVYKANTFVLEE